MLCVLLPLAGHVLSQCHVPQWIIVAATAAVALPGAAVLTRHRLTDTQLLGVLALAQLAYHVAYSLPGGKRGSAGIRWATDGEPTRCMSAGAVPGISAASPCLPADHFASASRTASGPAGNRSRPVVLDLVILQMANAGVIAATGDAAPDAWRRLVGHMLRSYAAPGAPIPALAEAPAPTALYRAMVRLTRTGSGAA
ncbi:hypothetical protein [Streptomyces canus]|uniref:hypothetical protein n=1 Tax=Streptomyces canus TaxID=58343 RepID=UPI00386705CF